MTNRVSLKISRAGEDVGVETFDRDIIKIGRLASAHLKLDDPKVSRIHAVIEVTASGEDISIIDMGSAEGTFVNGDKVTKVKLKDGDEIRLGDTRLVLQLGEVADTVAEAAAAAVVVAEDPAATELVRPSPSQHEMATLAELPLGDDTGGVFDGLSTEDAHAVAAAVVTPVLASQPPAAAPQPAPVVSSMPPTVTEVAASGAVSMSEDGLAEWSDPPPVAADLLSPGVAGNALVAPMPTAPSMEWYDPFGELHNVLIEPEEKVSKANRVLEVAVMWDGRLLDVRHYNEPKLVTMGESKKADIFVVSEGLPSNEFPLIRFSDGEYVLTYFDGLDGAILRDGTSVPLGALKGQPDDTFSKSYQFPLPLESLTTIDYGGLTLQLRFVQKPGIIPGGPFQEINYNWLNVFLVSLFLHVGFFATTALYPYDTTSLEEDLFSSPNRFAQFILNPPEKEKNSLLSKLMKQKEGESSAKHAGADGKAGKQDAKDTGKRMASKAEKPTNEMVVQNKLNQLFGKGGGSEGVSSVFGGGLGGELVGALGGVTGAQIGDSYGFGGLGLRGHGPGGGGSSTTTFGVGSIGTRGRGGGSSGYGSGSGGLGGKSDRNVAISQGTPVIMGSLDKEIIRRVIKENIAQIRYCYERELARSPGLYGKIMVKFIIAGTGQVSNAQVIESTMKNPEVESCISNKVRGWRFPKPKGGGIVIVSYPFIFKQSG
ncbi:MAG: AgmX/PglI C-terminal domain-containing protein [Pseudomonadota bacterium]